MNGRFQSWYQNPDINDTWQIIATSAEITPDGGLVMESPNHAQKYSGLGSIVICPDDANQTCFHFAGILGESSQLVRD